MLVDKIREIADYTGLEEYVEYIKETEKLKSFYYFTHTDATKQDLDLTFITCKINEDKGHVWVSYSRELYNKKGERISFTEDSLMLWYIEKKDDNWVITRKREPA